MNVFQIKTKPHNIERGRQFIEENFICIGWPGIGSLDHLSKDEIRGLLEKKYRYTGHSLGNNLGQVNSFVNTMKIGDVVIITEKSWAHIGIVGNYEYYPQYDSDKDGMCHKRSVNWISRVLIVELNSSIQKLLSNRNTICLYPETFEDSGLEKYLFNNVTEGHKQKNKFEEMYETALKIIESELTSSDIDRRFNAAVEILRLKNISNFN
ncbi:MAG: hypothetical protein WCQ41_06395 [Bacillota bacterium]